MNKKIILITIIILLIPTIKAYEWCEKEGYQYCVEQKETIKGTEITSKIAINLYDETGDAYEKFAFENFAIKGFYADIYYEGQLLYYIKNLNNWEEACSNETGITLCQGEIIRTTNNTITIKLANLYDEYKECPLFVSETCDDNIEWCEWAGVGYLKPPIYDCSHIRVTNCVYDNDCLPNQYCDKTNKYDWRNWTCKDTPINQTEQKRTERPTEGYTKAKPQAHGYSPEYTTEDLKTSFWDTIIKILKSIGNLFSGIAGNKNE